MRLLQHRNIEVSGATLECTFYGSGTPVVLLANAGCSTSYFDDLARVLAAGGLQTISVNLRGAGESRGSLDGITLHIWLPMWLGSSKLWIAVRRTSSAMPSAIGSLAAWRWTGPRWCAA